MNTQTLEIEEAQAGFVQLIEKVAAGSEATLAKQGEPLARLIPFDAPARPKKPGLLLGKIDVADDFNTPASDEY